MPLSPFQQLQVRDGAVQALVLSEASGTIAYDASGNSRNGTISGSVAYGDASCVRDDVNKAMGFSSTTTYVSLSTSGLPTGNSAWSLEAVVVPSYGTLSNNGHIATIGDAYTTGAVGFIAQNSTGGWNIGTWGGAGHDFGPFGASSPGYRYHVVGTYDGTTLRLYVNNVLVGTGTPSGGVNLNNVNPCIGVANQSAHGAGIGNPFVGDIQYFAVYPTALTATQIANHCAAAFNQNWASATDAAGIATPTINSLALQAAILTDAPLCYYPLADPSGTFTIVDQSGNGRHGTLIGGIKTGIAGTLADDRQTSLLFDGSSGYIRLPTSGLPTGNAPWSLEACTVPTSSTIGNNGCVLTMGDPYTVGAAAFICQNAGGGWFAGCWGRDLSPAGSSRGGQLAHLLATYDGTTLRLYVNGVLLSSGNPSGGVNLNQVNVTIGNAYQSHGVGAGNWFPGQVQHVAIYGTALSAARVTAHYNAIIARPQTFYVPGDAFGAGGITVTEILSAVDILSNTANLSITEMAVNGSTGSNFIAVFGSASNGATPMTATVNFTDGTNTAVTLSLSDWGTNGPVYGNYQITAMNRYDINTSPYSSTAVSVFLYGAVAALPTGKFVKSIVFPAPSGGKRYHIFAIQTSDLSSQAISAILPYNNPGVMHDRSSGTATANYNGNNNCYSYEMLASPTSGASCTPGGTIAYTAGGYSLKFYWPNLTWPAPTDNTTVVYDNYQADGTTITLNPSPGGFIDSMVLTPQPMIGGQDSNTVTEAVNFAASMSMNETMGVLDLMTGTGILTLVDALTASESLQTTATLTVQDMLTTSDLLQGAGVTAWTETLTANEALQTAITSVMTELLTPTELVQTSSALLWTETLMPSDVLASTIAWGMLDVLPFADLVQMQGAVNLPRDSNSVIDAVALAVAIQQGESQVFTDAWASLITAQMSDTITISESLTLVASLQVSDQATSNDNFTFLVLIATATAPPTVFAVAHLRDGKILVHLRDGIVTTHVRNGNVIVRGET